MKPRIFFRPTKIVRRRAKQLGLARSVRIDENLACEDAIVGAPPRAGRSKCEIISIRSCPRD